MAVDFEEIEARLMSSISIHDEGVMESVEYRAAEAIAVLRQRAERAEARVKELEHEQLMDLLDDKM